MIFLKCNIVTVHYRPLKVLMKPHHTLSATLALLFASQAGAAPSLHAYHALALAPDGKQIATLESNDPGGLPARPHAVLVLRSAADGKLTSQFDPCPSCDYDDPAWSPDGAALAVVANDRKAGTATLYVMRQQQSVAVASLKGIASTARWSPDGKRLALLATFDATKLSGAVEAGAAQVGEIGTADDEQRIAIVAASGGKLEAVSPADTFVYEYDWTPDGKGFVVTSAKGNGDNNWWIATLGHVDAASGKLRILAAPKMQINAPRVSPDGASVAFIGGLMSDFGSVGGDVYTMPLAGGTPRNLTPGIKASFNGLAWRGKHLIGTALMGANSTALALNAQDGSTRVLWSAPVHASAAEGALDFSADGSMAASVQEDFEHGPRILAGRLPALTVLTHDNDALAPQVTASSISWTNEGMAMQGWLLAPRQSTPGKHPMVVLVHGGPAAAATPRFVAEGELSNGLIRDLTARGYYVLMPNPRGSYGQGSAFSGANKRDFGGGDWRDIMAGVDAAIKAAPIDPARLGLMGHSYGGFMTMWGVTHTTRFKAAVAGAGIANWISYYGQNGIDQWMIPYFGASAYDDPAIYRAASPIETIKAATTPTFIYVGERDLECPSAQSVEFWHGLRAMGTPTSLVIYDGEGHALRRPATQRDLRARTLAWFERYL